MNTWKDPETKETYMWTDPHTGKPLEITGATAPPSTITFYAGGPTEIMRIERDKITVSEGVDVDAAAQAVLDSMKLLLGNWYRQVWNDAISAAAQQILDYDPDNWALLYQSECAEGIEGLKK